MSGIGKSTKQFHGLISSKPKLTTGPYPSPKQPNRTGKTSEGNIGTMKTSSRSSRGY